MLVEIWRKPSDWLKIWIHILQEVNHKDNCISERGERLFNYKEIAFLTNTSYSTVDHFIRWAKSAMMLATRKTTRGVFIKVLNYDVYQISDEYKSDTKSDTDAKQKRNKSDTINKNDKNDKNNNYVPILEEFNNRNECQLKMTDKKRTQCKTRLESFTQEQIFIAIKNRSEDDFMKGDNQYKKEYRKEWDSLFRNDDQIEKWLNRSKPKKEISVFNF